VGGKRTFRFQVGGLLSLSFAVGAACFASSDLTSDLSDAALGPVEPRGATRHFMARCRRLRTACDSSVRPSCSAAVAPRRWMSRAFGRPRAPSACHFVPPEAIGARSAAYRPRRPFGWDLWLDRHKCARQVHSPRNPRLRHKPVARSPCRPWSATNPILRGRTASSAAWATFPALKAARPAMSTSTKGLPPHQAYVRFWRTAIKSTSFAAASGARWQPEGKIQNAEATTIIPRTSPSRGLAGS